MGRRGARARRRRHSGSSSAAVERQSCGAELAVCALSHTETHTLRSWGLCVACCSRHPQQAAWRSDVTRAAATPCTTRLRRMTTASLAVGSNAAAAARSTPRIRQCSVAGRRQHQPPASRQLGLTRRDAHLARVWCSAGGTLTVHVAAARAAPLSIRCCRQQTSGARRRSAARPRAAGA